MSSPPPKFILIDAKYLFQAINLIVFKLIVVMKVARLLYTNSGIGILALWSNGVQKLWKWNRTEQNPSGKVRGLYSQIRTCACIHLIVIIFRMSMYSG